MSSKSMVMLGMTVGSLIGGYLPLLFGSDIFSLSTIFWSGIGGLLGIYIAYRLVES